MDRANQPRHTGPLITDPDQLVAVESRNALLQFDEVRRMVRDRKPHLNLTPDDICALQKLAVQGIFDCAGTFRKVPIVIYGTAH